MNRTIVSTLACVAAAAAPASAEPPTYALQYLGEATLITGMNDAGDVVGWDVVGSQLQGFVAGPLRPYQLLPLPAGYTSGWAKDINDAGVIVGSVGANEYPEFGDGIAWIPDGQGGYDMQLLGHLPGHTGSVATAVNNRGDIVGTSIFNDSGFGPTVWFNAPGGILNLAELGAPNMPQAINDNGLVVGFAGPPFDIDTLQTVPFAPGMLGGTAVLATNNNDDLAGYVVTSCQCARFAVRYTEQFGWEQLGGTVNPSAQVSAWDINDAGTTVGDMIGPAVHFDAYGTIPLSDLLAPEFGNWGFCACQGEAINNSGQIAAMGYNTSTFVGGVVLLTPLGQPIIPGDVNGDAVVNLDDHCAWQQNPIDLNGDGVVDEADEQWLIDLLAELGFIVTDCNANGAGDHCDIVSGLSADCDENGLPDECQADCNGDGVPDVCEPDCNANGVADPCDIAGGTSQDCNVNGIPDECDGGGLAEVLNVFDPPLELVENATVLDDLLVIDVGVIEDVDFTIDIAYRIGDLTVLLTHGETTITLIDRPGHPEVFLGNGQLGYDIVLDDEGRGGPIEDQGNFGPPFEPITSPPSYTPNEPLGSFDGMPSEGVWTVTIITSPNYSPAGSFNDWGLVVTLAAAEPCDPASGDLDGDGVVGILDFLALLAAWGPCPDPPDPCPADLDGDGVVGILDLLILLANWG